MTSDANISMSPGIATSTGGFLPSAGTPLPSDMLDKARDRVRITAILIGATWLFVIIMNEGVARVIGIRDQGIPWGWRQLSFTLTAMVASMGVAWLTTRLKTRPERAIDLGLVYQVFTALITSIITEDPPRTEPQAISWVCVAILLYPAIVPASPRKTLLAAVASATMVPLVLLYTMIVDPSYRPAPFIFLWLILPGYIAAVLAIVPARVIRTLGSQVRKARELGSYRIEHQIGRGGMGEVYRATHRLLARPAAVKLISPAALSSGSEEENRVVIERFRREAEAAATLRSPHTIELYDYGISEDGTFYYVMELLDGIDFHELVTKHGPQPPERVLHLMGQACDSLGEAHLSGLVHRDVKPSNLVACRMGLKTDYVKVLDFGLVKKGPDHAESQAHITTAGTVSGTPAFMAPETISGSAAAAPADVYALGCVAYWLLTGQNVFKAANATMMMMQHLQAAPVPPSHKSPTPVPRDLEDAVMRCLSKDPAERPSDAAELGAILERCRLPMEWTTQRATEWWRTRDLDRSAHEKFTGDVVIQ